MGGAKGAAEFLENPSLIGFAAVVAGAIPIAGDFASKFLRKGDEIAEMVPEAIKAAENIKVPSAPDFIVDSNGTVLRSGTAGVRKDLEMGGYPGIKTTETIEGGTIHRNVPGSGGPMDVRVMDGQANGGPFKGPRVRTTRAGSENDGVRSDGSPFRNNEAKSDRLRDSHVRLPPK